mgnify:CR=1 FL=1
MARYTDLDLNFDLHPLTKDVTVLNDMEALNAIERVIRNFEPRVELLNVLVRTNEDRNAYDVTIVFRPKNINQTTQVTFVLERTR